MLTDKNFSIPWSSDFIHLSEFWVFSFQIGALPAVVA